MNTIDIILDVDKTRAIPEGVSRDKIMQIRNGVKFIRIPNGMTSGKSAVGITAPINDGGYLFIEISMECFRAAAIAFKAAEGEK